MTWGILTEKLGGTDITDGNVLYGADLVSTFNSTGANLGEVKMFALSMTGAVTKSALQSCGWAICDGTTPASQGISSPTIETTPDLQDKFLCMSDDETSGTTGGSATHRHALGAIVGGSTFEAGGGYYTAYASNLPPFYELAFFIKVK